LGEEVWGNTVLELPDEAPRRWLELFSGEASLGAPAQAPNRMALGALLKHFPAVLLYHDAAMDTTRPVEENAHGTFTQQPA
jgi:hypothetical protein